MRHRGFQPAKHSHDLPSGSASPVGLPPKIQPDRPRCPQSALFVPFAFPTIIERLSLCTISSYIAYIAIAEAEYLCTGAD